MARVLDRKVVGARITGVSVPRPSVLREVAPAALGRRVRGAAIARVWRRAKLVVLDLSTADRLVVQPRFTGALLGEGPSFAPLPEGERRFLRVTFTLDGARRLHYRDIRCLGTLALMTPERFAEYQATLGPEPLDPAFTPAALHGRLCGSRQPVKKVLMDQQRVVGVGNIYANEALWMAGIAPARPASSLAPAETARLHAALVDVLARSIALGGTTFENFLDPDGQRGRFVDELQAYGRAGQACARCGGTMTGTHAVDGRQTVYCERCQR